MKTITTFSAAIATAIATLAAPAFAAQNDDFASGRIIVEPRAGLTVAEFTKLLKANGAGNARKLGQSNIHVIDVAHGSEKAIANKLKHNPHFKFAELDQRVAVSATTNDPMLGSEWHINKIGAGTAWDSAQGTGINIAILYSGMDAAHPDLAGRRLRPEGQGWFFFASLPSPPPVPPVLPLGKVSGARVRPGEKPGVQTARRTRAAGGVVLGSVCVRSSGAEIQHSHPNREAVGDLVQDNGAAGIGDIAVDLHTTIDRAGMHDQAVLLQLLRTLFGKPEERGVFAE